MELETHVQANTNIRPLPIHKGECHFIHIDLGDKYLQATNSGTRRCPATSENPGTRHTPSINHFLSDK